MREYTFTLETEMHMIPPSTTVTAVANDIEQAREIAQEPAKEICDEFDDNLRFLDVDDILVKNE